MKLAVQVAAGDRHGVFPLLSPRTQDLICVIEGKGMETKTHWKWCQVGATLITCLFMMVFNWHIQTLVVFSYI